MIGTILTVWLILKMFGIGKEIGSFIWNGVSFSVSALVAGVAAYFFTRWVMKKMTDRGTDGGGEVLEDPEPVRVDTGTEKKEEEPYYPETKYFNR